MALSQLLSANKVMKPTHKMLSLLRRVGVVERSQNKGQQLEKCWGDSRFKNPKLGVQLAQKRQRVGRDRGDRREGCVANYAKYLYASKARKIFAIYLSHVPHSPSKQKR